MASPAPIAVIGVGCRFPGGVTSLDEVRIILLIPMLTGRLCPENILAYEGRWISDQYAHCHSSSASYTLAPQDTVPFPSHDGTHPPSTTNTPAGRSRSLRAEGIFSVRMWHALMPGSSEYRLVTPMVLIPSRGCFCRRRTQLSRMQDCPWSRSEAAILLST